MTDNYDLDLTDDGPTNEQDRAGSGPDGGGRVTDGHSSDPASARGDDGSDAPVGVTVPADHLGAFVAEAFEDAERSTSWDETIDAVVPEEARGEWAALSVRKRVIELLDLADGFDRRAADLLESIPLDRGRPTGKIRERFAEAERLRRNADLLRNGIAAGYAEGRVGDEDLVAAIESFGFDTARIAEREDALDAVASAYDLDYRPYGGTLMTDREDDRDAEEFEAW